jgi:phospholipid transport system transporter-binding protein
MSAGAAAHAQAIPARIVRNDDTLRFEGSLLRASVPGLWPAADAAFAGVRRFDLHAVDRVDSAGLALLSLLAERCGDVAIDGAPAGLSELRAAYRLGDDLRFARV